MAGIKSLLSSEFIASKQSTEFYHFVKRLSDAKSKAVIALQEHAVVENKELTGKRRTQEEHSLVTHELKDIADHIGLPDMPSVLCKETNITLFESSPQSV